MKRFIKRIIVISSLALAVATVRAADKPNILIILADDLGFSDIGCFGSEIKTPNIDSLAKNGIRYTQFYNTARCCPSRASLLTGLYPHQTGLGHMMVDRGIEGYRSNLNRNCATIAEVLRPAGYRTYMCGKWHVTKFDGPKDDQSNWPVQRGFDKFYGTLRGYGSFYDPSALCRQNTFITPVNDPEYKPKEYYYTDALSDNAVQYLHQHQTESPGKPFFMYLAYTAAHWPMHALEKDIERYKGKFDTGYDPVRKARAERLKQLGLIDPKWEIPATAGDWDSVKKKKWEARCKEVFDAMIDNMDQGIGRVIAELEQQKQLENTLIFFLQDNGGCAEDMGRKAPPAGSEPRLRPMKPDELQMQTKPPMQTRDGRWVRTGPGVMPGPADTYIAYGRAWANVSNTPFREYKHWVHEGGISTPLIAHWPKGIPAKRTGAIEKSPGHVIDLMATCVDVAGATYPKELHGEKIKPMEGVSLRTTFNGDVLARKNPIFWEHESNRAVRDGNWKLVAKADESWELYDMEADRTEMHNLASKNPKKVQEMSASWDAWAARANVLPLGGWKGKAAGE
ncbi:MAG: atsA 17 [Verrucomicrobiales bacterium]|nr:atsA 17 [Verrucomicrobiales bacterium]